LTLLRSSLRDGLLALLRSFTRPGIYGVAVLALAVWALAYQVKQPYVVDVANMAYHPYISGFNDIEALPGDPSDRYRWSTGSPSIFIPGVGNQPVVVTLTTVGARPEGTPPAIEIGARGQQFTIQTAAEERNDTFLLERGDPLDSDILLSMDVPVFTPDNDPRELGVIIRRVEVVPADFGLRPLVVASVGVLVGLLAGVAGLFALVIVTTRRSRPALVTAGIAAALAAAGIAFARPDTAFLAGQLPSLGLWTLALGWLGRGALDMSLAPVRHRDLVAGAGSLAFALAFAIRFGGLTNAQFLTSDLMLHVNNTLGVLQGDLVFTEPVPDGTPVPYPPAYYLLVGGLSLAFGQSAEVLGLILKWTASALDASVCLALAWACTFVWSARTGAWAAATYAASAAAFDLFSAGNYTNIFAQSILNLSLLFGVAYLGSGEWAALRWAPAWLTIGFGLTMLGHYGMMLGALAIVTLFLLWALAAQLRGRCPPRVWTVIGAAVVALGASFALYYWRLTDLIIDQWGGVVTRLVGGQAAPQTPRPSLTHALGRLPGKIGELVGWPAVVAGLAGLTSSRALKGGATALVGAWLAAALLFAVLDQVVGDAVRWYYMAAVPLALPAGLFLAQLANRRGSGRGLALLVLAAMSWHMITFWINLIFTRYH
jgi:hypothetical protein